LSLDDFIRTSDQNRHWPGARKLWKKLAENGDLYKKTYRGIYCVGHEAFITEKDLIDGKCQDHQKAPETIEEENWFFKLSDYGKKIEKLILKDKLRIVPESRKNEILAFIRSGLKDVSFSRPSKDLKWGVPVPDDSSQTMYVWADALVNYISALGYGSEDESLFKKYWPADIQVIGKDNLRFHAAIWPGMLLATGIKLPKTIFVHGFINVDGQKISKTVGNVIDPAALVGKYGAEAVRYFLLREFSPFEDGNFSYAAFEERYNSDLANGLGNFTSRVLAMGEKLGKIKAEKEDKLVIQKIKSIKKIFEEDIKESRIHEALMAIWELIHYGDAYVNEKQAWNHPECIYTLIVILDTIAALLNPFLPKTSEKITQAIAWEDKSSLRVKKTENLFPRIP
ncbi:MAG: class I tRNA ligase family protein, partial [Patescibacteria group bacterium]